MTKNNTKRILVLLFFMAGMFPLTGAAESGDLILNVKYIMYNNSIPFIHVDTKTKIDKKTYPVPGMTIAVYLDSISDDHKAGKLKTDERGNATFIIPPALKTIWDASSKHTFICTSAANKKFEESEQEFEITRAKLLLDTLNDGEARSITATLMEMSGKEWKPVKEIDVKIGVSRLGGILSAGADPTFATNEEGIATAAFEREKLPGDKKGNLTLAAKVEDNEVYGNLVVEMNAPWGITPVKGHDTFQDRSLWAKRQKAPYWLLLIANSIIFSVWGTIIYLIVQIFKLKKLGEEKPALKSVN